MHAIGDATDIVVLQTTTHYAPLFFGHQILKAKGTYDPKRLMGVTTLDVVRAKTFYAEKKGLKVNDVEVPVVGGHAGITILPLFSQVLTSC